MIFDDRSTLRTVNDAPNSDCIKIFLYLACNQPQDGIRGFQVDKNQLNYDLKLSRTKFYKALHWLKENAVVNEIKQVYESDFMVNPYIVMNNCDREARIAEWNRRCDIAINKKIAARRRKRLRELKKQF